MGMLWPRVIRKALIVDSSPTGSRPSSRKEVSNALDNGQEPGLNPAN